LVPINSQTRNKSFEMDEEERNKKLRAGKEKVPM
jgi:hypothetical protein